MSNSFLDLLARPQPVPGGGAAAAHGALVGLALMEKILRVEANRSHISDEQKAYWGNLLKEVSRLTETLRHLRDEDGKAYLMLAEARASGEKSAMLDPELQEATDCPINIMRAIPEALTCVARAGAYCKRHLLSDLLVSAELLHAAAQGACHIANANLRLFTDASVRADYRMQLEAIQNECHAFLLKAKESIAERMNRGPGRVSEGRSPLTRGAQVKIE